MYKSKKDVDKLVENMLSKMSLKEFQTRAYSVAHKYFEVGDYANCQKYVEQYLAHKDNNAAAYKLLGQALHKMGQKEKALEQYKASLDIDPTHTSVILEICELLADDEVVIDPGRAKYWCEKAEATFPRHPVTFKLRERLITVSNPDSQALVTLLTSELAIRPKDVLLHVRLLKHYLNTNKVKEAFDHACIVEFRDKTFINNYAWYEILNELLNHNAHNTMDWLYQLLLLTVRERICLLSITETPSGSSKSLIESNELLHFYDQAINKVAKLGASPGFGEFHTALLQHHRGQIAFHAATLLLKKAKKDQLSWRDATTLAAPLMLAAWQTVPLDSKVNWLRGTPEKQVSAVNRWYSEGSYRCSQAGHYLLSVIQDKNQSFLDQVSQCYSGTHWRDKFYKKIFPSKTHTDKMNSSYFASDAFNPPIFRIPRKPEVEAYDSDAQKEYPNSLHHFVWTVLNYKNLAHYKCTIFEMLDFKGTTCSPESLNKLDILAFLYCATLTAQQVKAKEYSYMTSDKPAVLPASITDLLCSLTQMKWWDCAYKLSQNELGTELTDIRATLSRGIEVIRCMDNHGLDPELLCFLGRIFGEGSKLSANTDEKVKLVERACLYYQSAVPLLEKLKSRIVEKISGKRIFCYTHKELATKELNALLEECKMYVAVNHLNNSEYEKVIEIISNLKSPEAYYHLAQTYKKMALEENNLSRDDETRSKVSVLLSKAKTFAFKALDKLRENEINKTNALYSDIQELIEEIQIHFNKMEPDSFAVMNDGDGKYSSDENVSGISEFLQPRMNSRMYRNISSTPKANNANSTNYRTAMDSQLMENTARIDQSRMDQSHLVKIENEIKKLQKRESNINDFMEQTKCWFEENQKLGNQIISTIQSNMQSTTDQFEMLKISVNKVKGEIDECRNEYKDVGELKKDIADLKKEVTKLKKGSSEPNFDDSELYNLDDDYRTNDASSFASRLQFPSSGVIPPFNQRLVPPFSVPPNAYQLYNQSFYNLYNQYSQFAQPSTVPGAPSLFDPSRSQMNYPGVYPTPDQMYLDVAHLVPPSIPTVPPVPPVPIAATIPTVPTMPAGIVPPPSTKISSMESKESLRSLPVNVVITSSDPLPTYTTTPAPALSVTIPPKHIKGIPHNYQIAMPSTNDTSVTSPPVFVFPQNKTTATSASTLSNWSVFKATSVNATSAIQSALQEPLFSVPKISTDTINTTKTVVEGIFGISPNTSLNKSRTISEKSNTSIENYDPCPDFKPIVPLPAEVKVTTGEEDEYAIFNARAKLFRFTDKQWKERGIGEMKLLKHKTSGKVRVLMRREQVHKICANHIITADIEIKPMKNETKAYFWVANDFADESVVLEKFCIRFKTADIALDFYNAFEKARQESMANKTLSPAVPKSEPVKLETRKFGSGITAQSVTSSPGKAVVGGFTFSSTPSFKAVSDDTESEVNKPQELSSKVNVFSGLSFKTNSNATSNIFSTATTIISSPNNTTQNATSNKLNNSDTVEEFEPNVDFKPVIPLPELVDQKTGEEEETILYEHRAKLLRFDAATKEWKERGLGNIKLLAHKDNIQKVRLLMRREQIMKVCCNHSVTKDMQFQKMPNMDKAVTWCAKDFSDGELVAETFCLRFKTANLCDKFIEAVQTAQSKIKDESKTAKEEQNAAKQTNQTGFGDKFKAKPGSWYCDKCYTNNLETFNKCACCESPNPNSTAEAKPVTNASSNVTKTVGWGDKFKPKAGSWECQACLIRNEGSLEICSACNSPKDPSKAKTSVIKQQDNMPKFNFGIPPATATSTVAVSTQSVAVSTGQEPFKLNPATNTKSIFGSAETGTPQFRFGMPAPTTEPKQSEKASIFDGTGGHKFSFGTPTNVPKFGATESSITFGAKPNDPFAADSAPIDFTLKNNNEQITSVKPALLPTPQTNSSTFGIKEDSKFGYVFKPKTVKSPANTSHNDDEESDDNEYSPEDECHQAFTPVIPLPEKVEVVTGEENESELYGHLAKLYRYTTGEWKERGKGIVKILKHKDTGKLRVVMRRDQVLKICLNHSLTTEIIYTLKDEKSWQFIANDFSEGEISLDHFCLRFKNKEIASGFKDAVDKALQGLSSDNPLQDENDDVIFVTEIQASQEDKQKAKQLMLPENFFTYKSKEPCVGCRGCDHDNETTPTASISEKVISVQTKETAPAVTKPITAANATIFKTQGILNNNVSTPVKGFFATASSFQSPTNSIYGTPTNSEKTFDTSIFRTPLESLGSNSKASLLGTGRSSSDNNATNKENTFIPKSNLLSELEEDNSGNDISNNKPASFTLAPPKLGIFSSSSESTNKFSFGTNQSKSVSSDNPLTVGSTFGTSSNKSIFDNKTENQNAEVKSIFGDDNKSENLFTSLNQGSIFGPGALTNNQQKPSSNIFGSSFGSGTSIFGTNANSNNQVFGNGKSIFGMGNQAPSFGVASNVEKPAVSEVQADTPKSNVISDNKSEENSKAEKTKSIFSLDDNLSFAALSTGTGTGVGFDQKNPDFKWEGVGQQLFGGKKSQDADKSHNESGDGDEVGGAGADEEYDPHYAPIVPLPDKIVVTTGEENEEKLFGERCKLYRYDDKCREWKERGIGEMKILYHPDSKTYRFILRREQVHKAVLNMRLHMDLELLQMKNSDRAWTWAGRNFAENPAGEQETLAVRFKSVALATSFQEKVIECVRKLQAVAANTIKEERESSDVIPLRLPKHLQESARADNAMSCQVKQQTSLVAAPSADEVAASNYETTEEIASPRSDVFKQVHFTESVEYPDGGEYHEDQEYEEEADYDGYEEDEEYTYHTCEGEVIIQKDNTETICSTAYIQVMFDHEICTPKILITDSTTNEILADMVIYTDTEFQMSGETCMWSGKDYTSSVPVDKTITINFFDTDAALQFYDSCETSKAAACSSTDPET